MDRVTPESAGFSAERLARIGAHMERYIEERKLPGMMTVVARAEGVPHFECFGSRNDATGAPMTADTIFRIYSMTKPITTVAALMLMEEGLLQLADPVAKFIPAFADTKVFVRSGYTDMELAEQGPPMTIQHLMTHTAGLSYGFHRDSPVEEMYRQSQRRDRGVELSDVVEEFAQLPLVHQPGTAWRYSVATDVLGHVVERASGQSLDDFFRERIFEPLGMMDTGFWVPENQVHRFAATHGPDPQAGELSVIDAPESSRFLQPTRNYSGGGGLVSTAADYLQFARMLLNEGTLNGNRLLGRKTVELMRMNHLPATLLPIGIGDSELRGYGFGLGVSVLMDVARGATPGSAGLYGWSGAACTRFWVDPAEELIGMFFTQYMPSGRYPIQSEFRTLVYQAVI